MFDLIIFRADVEFYLSVMFCYEIVEMATSSFVKLKDLMIINGCVEMKSTRTKFVELKIVTLELVSH